MWLDILNFGKSQGYKTCALCGHSIFAAAMISTMDVGEVLDIQVENKENVCNIKFTIQEK